MRVGTKGPQCLGVALLFLPPYAPNFNLIERFWKCVHETCLYSQYSADSVAFQPAILVCIEQSSPTYRKELESLVTLPFQTFKEVQVLGAAMLRCGQLGLSIEE